MFLEIPVVGNRLQMVAELWRRLPFAGSLSLQLILLSDDIVLLVRLNFSVILCFPYVAP